MLPLSLIALLLQVSAFLPHNVHAQGRPPSSSSSPSIPLPSNTPPKPSSRLSINSLTPFTISNLPSPPVFSIPATFDVISITLASCSAGQDTARFFLSNDSNVPDPGPNDVGSSPGVAEIVLDDLGMGEWIGSLDEGGFLSVVAGGSGGAQQSFELGVSNTGEPLHIVLLSWSRLMLIFQDQCTQTMLHFHYSEILHPTRF